MKDDLRDPETSVATLANGVRVIAIRQPHVETVGVSVFVRSGSQHESARLNGISHVVEHMAFKGTHERDCQKINLDAERLGADVNAHTDKDHTAFHMSGLAGHIDADRVLADAQAAFGSMPAGSANAVEKPAYLGGIATRRQAGCSQTHVVLGFPIPGLADE